MLGHEVSCCLGTLRGGESVSKLALGAHCPKLASGDGIVLCDKLAEEVLPRFTFAALNLFGDFPLTGDVLFIYCMVVVT